MSDIKKELIFGIILAAGSSKRLGRPKSLVNIGDDKLINYIVKRLKKNNVEALIVTRSEIFSDIQESIEDARIIVNENPEAGRTGTLQVGLNYLKSEIMEKFKVLVVPVDRPGFSDSTLLQLISYDETICPMKNGKGGHPLMISESDIRKITSQKPNVPLRDIIEPNKFEVLDPYLHINIDTEEDVTILDSILNI